MQQYYLCAIVRMYHIIAKAGICGEYNDSLPLGQLSWVLRTPLICNPSRQPDSLVDCLQADFLLPKPR